jgi:hypothetical protein
MNLDPDGDEYWPEDDPRWLGELHELLAKLRDEMLAEATELN